MKRILTVAIIGLAAATAQAEGDPAGWSIGVAGVFGDYSLDSGIIDDTSVGAKVFGQYRFNQWVGLEAAYVNAGEFDENGSEGRLELTVDGFSMSLVGYAPWGGEDVDFYGKIGYFDFDQELLQDGSPQTRSADGFTAGAGARLSVSERIGIRAEFDWYALDDADFWTVSLGVDWRFGGR